ncbi:MAG: GldG family protein [Anaerolineales bacterium]|nr:GldG family protein [Anaerolineales bacterium]MCX7754100.1 GldG family protein [Anaerolineales bacterium]MDW8278817.1 Gldg family protein [Anaerolineales bacterium]
MKTDPRRFAFLGLLLSLLALLTFIGFLVVRGLTIAGTATVDPDLLQNGLLISGLSIILGLALTAILDPESTRRFLVGRQAQYGSNSLITLLAFVGILIFVNALAYQNKQTWDLTEDKSNSLAPETLEILKSLPEPVFARAYYTTRTSSDEARKLLDRFAQNSNQKFTYEFVDPEFNPIAAQEDGIERDGTIILKMGERKEPVTFASEQELDAALLRLINPETRVIYFTIGHGENSIEEPSDIAYTQAVATLRKKNYTVKTLDLRAEGKVPEDAQAVVVSGPQRPLTEPEAQALEAYLNNGGAVIVMYEPQPLSRFENNPDPLADVLAKWGITFDNNFVIDRNANPASFAVSDINAYPNHPITQRMAGFYSFYPTARSLTLNTETPGVTLTRLVITNANAWGETNFASIDQNQVNQEAEDMPGPLTLAAAAENTTSKGRLVVFGDSEFAADALYVRGNGDIFINAVDWAAEQENLISLTPKSPAPRTFRAPGTLGFIGFVLTSICVLPLVVIGGGVWSWFSRRRRG